MAKEIDIREIQEAVRRKYAEISRTAEGRLAYPTGIAGAKALGYDESLMKEIPSEILDSFCGVGNPFRLGPIHLAEAVLDVGCGAGFDLFIAGKMVGPEGRAHGIDLTPEMVEKAQNLLKEAVKPEVQVQLAGAEAIPYDDDTFDVVISNGALNLSPMKEKSFQEIHRVLNPGGRLQFADVVLKEELPSQVADSLEAWTD
jgi:SAM-dependent methyltransferase